jgi:hypothetical protein
MTSSRGPQVGRPAWPARPPTPCGLCLVCCTPLTHGSTWFGSLGLQHAQARTPTTAPTPATPLLLPIILANWRLPAAPPPPAGPLGHDAGGASLMSLPESRPLTGLGLGRGLVPGPAAGDQGLYDEAQRARNAGALASFPLQDWGQPAAGRPIPGSGGLPACGLCRPCRGQARSCGCCSPLPDAGVPLLTVTLLLTTMVWYGSESVELTVGHPPLRPPPRPDPRLTCTPSPARAPCRPPQSHAHHPRPGPRLRSPQRSCGHLSTAGSHPPPLRPSAGRRPAAAWRRRLHCPSLQCPAAPQPHPQPQPHPALQPSRARGCRPRLPRDWPSGPGPRPRRPGPRPRGPHPWARQGPEPHPDPRHSRGQ